MDIRQRLKRLESIPKPILRTRDIEPYTRIQSPWGVLVVLSNTPAYKRRVGTETYTFHRLITDTHTLISEANNAWQYV